jgi:hypothetical protein
MATRKVRNTSNQPLYLNLPGGRSQKIPARSLVEVDEADLNCDELAFHRSRGNITVVEAAPAAEAKPEGKSKEDSKSTEKAKDEKGGES